MTYAKFVIVKSDLMNHIALWPLGTWAFAYACVCPDIFFFFLTLSQWNKFRLCTIFLFFSANEISAPLLNEYGWTSACTHLYFAFCSQELISGNHLYKQPRKLCNRIITHMFTSQGPISPGWGKGNYSSCPISLPSPRLVIKFVVWLWINTCCIVCGVTYMYFS